MFSGNNAYNAASLEAVGHARLEAAIAWIARVGRGRFLECKWFIYLPGYLGEVGNLDGKRK